jgi:hypothetical protein
MTGVEASAAMVRRMNLQIDALCERDGASNRAPPVGRADASAATRSFDAQRPEACPLAVRPPGFSTAHRVGRRGTAVRPPGLTVAHHVGVRRPSCVENFFDRFEYGGAVGTRYSGNVAVVAARGHSGNVARFAARGRPRFNASYAARCTR